MLNMFLFEIDVLHLVAVVVLGSKLATGKTVLYTESFLDKWISSMFSKLETGASLR